VPREGDLSEVAKSEEWRGKSREARIAEALKGDEAAEGESASQSFRCFNGSDGPSEGFCEGTLMATLYVRNVPDELYEWLKARAKERGMSIGKLVIELLEKALRDEEMALRAESLRR
jgi:hypothetical protein